MVVMAAMATAVAANWCRGQCIIVHTRERSLLMFRLHAHHQCNLDARNWSAFSMGSFGGTHRHTIYIPKLPFWLLSISLDTYAGWRLHHAETSFKTALTKGMWDSLSRAPRHWPESSSSFGDFELQISSNLDMHCVTHPESCTLWSAFWIQVQNLLCVFVDHACLPAFLLNCTQLKPLHRHCAAMLCCCMQCAMSLSVCLPPSCTEIQIL